MPKSTYTYSNRYLSYTGPGPTATLQNHLGPTYWLYCLCSPCSTITQAPTSHRPTVPTLLTYLLHQSMIPPYHLCRPTVPISTFYANLRSSVPCHFLLVLNSGVLNSFKCLKHFIWSPRCFKWNMEIMSFYYVNLLTLPVLPVRYSIPFSFLFNFGLAGSSKFVYSSSCFGWWPWPASWENREITKTEIWFMHHTFVCLSVTMMSFLHEIR